MLLSQQALLRGLLRGSLCSAHSAECVAEFSGIKEFLVARASGDALIVDCDTCSISRRHADEITRSRRARRVVFVTDMPGAYHLHCLFHHGFHGLLHKRDTVEEFTSGMAAVLAGNFFVSARVVASERREFSRILSEREIVAIRAMVLHPTLTRSAQELNVSLATMRTHRRNIFAKLGLRSQMHLVAFGVRTGVVSPDDWLRTSAVRDESARTGMNDDGAVDRLR